MKLLRPITHSILFPEEADLKRPTRRIIVPPIWDRDAVIGVFLLVELLERRQLPVWDISPVIRAASQLLKSNVHGVPVKIFRGGELRRVKAQAHIESVLREFLREPVTKLHQTGKWDLLQPFRLATYNELIGFGLERKVPEFELEALMEAMIEQGIQADEATKDILLKRSRLAQNKIVGNMMERLGL
jgi:hypothetical protein